MKNTQFWTLLLAQVPGIRPIFIRDKQILLYICSPEQSERSWKEVLNDILPFSNVLVSYEDGGKPRLFIEEIELKFSVSHTKGLLVFAFSQNGEIGVDVELEDRKVHPRLVARMHHPEELSLDVISPIQTWIIKESALKADGAGLRHAMNKVLLREEESEVWSLDLGKSYGKYLGKFVRFNSFIIAVCVQEIPLD